MDYAGPERRLIWEVIRRAVMDAAGYAEGGKWAESMIRAEAERWLTRWTEADHRYEFTFPWCCEALDLCPHETRAKVYSAIANGRVKGAGKNWTEAAWAFFCDVAESPTQQEVYFL